MLGHCFYDFKVALSLLHILLLSPCLFSLISCLVFTVFIGVYFTGNGGAVNRALPKQEFPFYSVPSLDYFLTGANSEQSLSSSTGLNSTPVTDVIVASTLQSSMALAQPPKEFACTICGRKFSLKCNLNRHNLVHTGVRNYGCEVCGQRFVLRQHLKKHLTRHAKECS
ncbi:oocyte zinc finger protein XlCOF15 [Dermacentor silvarum]|uniref:oocyte zinc finger protein XlCOF15 n=1 Tax=Dermacentor silvarum TaxID=543639 RepID=UPI002100B424|nr:oocyte zinc finger protein XlCOF15 [Dermacentor silvarum]